MLRLVLVLLTLRQDSVRSLTWCSDSLCSSCLYGYRYSSKMCLSQCPSGYNTNSNAMSCSSVQTSLLFSINLKNSLPFDSNSVGQFSHPLGLSLTDSSKLTPIFTKNRGLYFESTSYLQSQQNWVPSPDFTTLFVAKALKKGILYQIYSQNLTVFEISANETFYIAKILLSAGNTNYTYTMTYANSGKWTFFRFYTRQIGEILNIFFTPMIKTLAYNEFRAQISNLTFSLGSENNGSFNGFLFSLDHYNTFINTNIALIPDNKCLYGEYSIDSTCLPCNASCSTWPACEKASCNLCYSDMCLNCTGYGYNDCLNCSSEHLPCGLGFQCLSGSLFNCSLCNSSWELRGGNCLLPAYNYDENLLLAPVINAKFDKIKMYHDIFQSGANGNTYAPYSSPQIDDPLPMAQRGMAFIRNRLFYLKSTVPIVLNYEFTIAVWYFMLNFGNYFDKTTLTIGPSYKISAKLTDEINSQIYSSLDVGENLGVWKLRIYSIKFNTDTTSFIVRSSSNTLSTTSIKGYLFIDSNTTLYLGNYNTLSFYGYIYSVTIWHTFIDDLSAYFNPCGPDLQGSCFPACWIDQLYVSEYNLCVYFNLITAKGYSKPGRPGQCAQHNCTNCDSYENDAICFTTVANPCDPGLITRNGDRCCDIMCTLCTKLYSYGCLICEPNFFLAGIKCYLNCPLGFEIDSPSTCILSKTLTIYAQFTEITGIVKSLPYDIPFIPGNSTLFYPSSSIFNPIPTLNRGYYFSSRSFMNSTKFTLFYNFTVNLFIKVISDGSVFSINTVELTNTVGRWSYYNKLMPVVQLNSWAILSVRISTADNGLQYIKVLVNQGVAIFDENFRVFAIFNESSQSLQLGSPINSFTGFIYTVAVYNGEFFSLYTDFNICETGSNCISNCLISKIALNNTCADCLSTCNSGCVRNEDCNLCNDPNCLNCSSFSESCVKCSDGFYLENNKCLCNPGFYMKPRDIYNCYACHPECLTCSNELRTGCLACKQTFELQPDFSCSCPKHQYNNTGTCENCNELCDNCDQSKDNCTSCKIDFVLVNNSCLCEDGFFLQGTNCEPCSVNCQTCFKTSLNCSSCMQGTELTSSFECRCIGSKYLHEGKCENCYSYCSKCDEFGESKCLECKTGFTLLDNGRCQCKNGLYWDTVIEDCIQCSDFCLLCNTFNESGCENCNEDCLFCQDFSVFRNNFCECVDGYYEKQGACLPCDASCLTCTNGNFYSCSSCQHYFLERVCIDNCPIGYSNKENICNLIPTNFLVFSFDFFYSNDEFIDSANNFKAITPISESLSAPVLAYDRGVYYNGINSALILGNYKENSYIFTPFFMLSMWINSNNNEGGLISIKNQNNSFDNLALLLRGSSVKVLVHLNELTHSFESNQTVYKDQWSYVGLYVYHDTLTSMLMLINGIQEYSYSISEVPFFEQLNSSFYIGCSMTESLFFTGFLRELKLYRNFTSLSFLYSTQCDSCYICKTSKICFNPCGISEYFDLNTKNCQECNSDCTSGCRHKESCSLCFESACTACSDFNEGTCLGCDEGYELKNGICRKCEEGLFYNSQNKLCEVCRGLCKTCIDQYICTSCKDDSRLTKGSCICSLGYKLLENSCERIYFSAKITINLNNTVNLYFSESLMVPLSKDQIKVKVNENECFFNLTMKNMSIFSVSCFTNDHVELDSYISIIFIQDILSIKNSLLKNETLRLKLFVKENSSKESKIVEAKNLATKSSNIAVSISLSLTFLNFDTSTLFNFANFAETFSVIALYDLDLPEEILEFLRSVRIQKSMPNILEGKIDKIEKSSLDPIAEIVLVGLVAKLIIKRTKLTKEQQSIVDRKYLALFENYKKDQFISTVFPLVFVTRRILIAVCIFLIPNNTYRLIFSFVLSFTYLVFILTSTCFLSKIDNTLHGFNEILTAFLHIVLFFTLSSGENELKSNAYEIIKSIVLISWSLNICCSLIKSFINLRSKIKDCLDKKKPENRILPDTNFDIPSQIIKSHSIPNSNKSSMNNSSIISVESNEILKTKSEKLEIVDLE